MSKKRVNYLSCIEGEEVGKEIHCHAENNALFVDLDKCVCVCLPVCVVLSYTLDKVNLGLFPNNHYPKFLVA